MYMIHFQQYLNNFYYFSIKQLEDQEARVQEFLHESSKPLARLRDDRDLEDSLKQVERAGDPMLKYMRDRKRERGELGPGNDYFYYLFIPSFFQNVFAYLGIWEVFVIILLIMR